MTIHQHWNGLCLDGGWLLKANLAHRIQDIIGKAQLAKPWTLVLFTYIFGFFVVLRLFCDLLLCGGLRYLVGRRLGRVRGIPQHISHIQWLVAIILAMQTVLSNRQIVFDRLVHVAGDVFSITHCLPRLRA